MASPRMGGSSQSTQKKQSKKHARWRKNKNKFIKRLEEQIAALKKQTEDLTQANLQPQAASRTPNRLPDADELPAHASKRGDELNNKSNDEPNDEPNDIQGSNQQSVLANTTAAAVRSRPPPTKPVPPSNDDLPILFDTIAGVETGLAHQAFPNAVSHVESLFSSASRCVLSEYFVKSIVE
ncbi:hypothetical protein H2203_008184 [Taxawa tesnikishii (nom. ined.)]|nr:hypothetical protein H2203_008184 [Dothideales sp. JES 119]